jgi:ATP synthase protein I
MEKNQWDFLKQIGKLLSIGIILVSATFIGLFIGLFLDKIFKTKPIFTIIFLIFGIIAGFKEIIRMTLKEINK